MRAPRTALEPGRITRREWLRFLSKCVEGDICTCGQGDPHRHWIWVAGKFADDYGAFAWRGRNYKAHRFAYIALEGAIPEKQVPDHLCRRRACVNPQCIEVTTNKQNALRGQGVGARNAAKTHCPKGHALTPDNLVRYHWERGGFRICKTCDRQRSRTTMARLRKENPQFYERQVAATRTWRERRAAPRIGNAKA